MSLQDDQENSLSKEDEGNINFSQEEGGFDVKPYLDPEVANLHEKPIRVLHLGDENELDKENLAETVGRSWIEIEWVDHSRAMLFSFPKAIPWACYPITTDPWFAISDLRPMSSSSIAREIAQESLASYFDMFEAFVISTPQLSSPQYISDSNYMAGYLVSKLRRNPLIPIWITGNEVESENKTLKSISAEDLMWTSGGSMRLLYGYRLNFAAITMEFVKKAMNIPSPRADQSIRIREKRGDWGFNEEARDIRLRELRSGMVPRGLDDPLALQILYALRRKDKLAVLADGSGPLSGLLTTTSDGLVRQWKGSGKFPARNAHAISFGRAEGALIGLRLAYWDTVNGEAGITERGQAFLDMLPKECEDPDVVLRWRDPETDSIPSSAKPSIDAWMIRHFYRIKTLLENS